MLPGIVLTCKLEIHMSIVNIIMGSSSCTETRGRFKLRGGILSELNMHMPSKTGITYVLDLYS